MSRNLALKSLDSSAGSPGQAERRLEFYFSQNPALDDRDRAFAVHLVQGVLRWQIRLDWIISQYVRFPFKKIDPSVLNILRLALFQILFLDRIPESAAVNEAAKQARKMGQNHVVKFVNGILRQICRNKDRLPYPKPEKDRSYYASVYFSYPLWLVKKWTSELGPEMTLHLLKAGNEIPKLTIRTNTLKTNRQDLLNRLAEEEVEGRAVPFAPEGIHLIHFKGSISRLNAFKEGLFQVQGEAAQICAHLLSPAKEDLTADMCAGLGGKSTHLAQLMGDRGRIVAADNSFTRLRGLRQNTERLGIKSIFPLAADVSGSVSFFRSAFGKIMVDGPCSGLGVISKHPDTKLAKKEDDIKRLAMIQKSILSQSCGVLDRLGEMLYVTCTISKEENEGVVETLLRHSKDIVLQDLHHRIPPWGLELVDDNGFFKTFPHIHGMDGFFAALFRKNSS
ncbi:MAG: 16S rRNA (cytosine(967)-C(5))-methyltransferase RsmB [Deltaproteobacteria bacterium]|nr:16S rRNA (cytosine(967)-C(5))-methyltransferase RsmB [Deltaproteobacteria bacterium]